LGGFISDSLGFIFATKVIQKNCKLPCHSDGVVGLDLGANDLLDKLKSIGFVRSLNDALDDDRTTVRGRGLGLDKSNELRVKRLVEPAILKKELSAIGVRKSKFRVELDRAIEGGKSLLEPPQPMQRHTEVVEKRGMIRQFLDRALEVNDSGFIITPLSLQLAKALLAGAPFRTDFQVIKENSFRLGVITEAHQDDDEHLHSAAMLRVAFQNAATLNRCLQWQLGRLVDLRAPKQRRNILVGGDFRHRAIVPRSLCEEAKVALRTKSDQPNRIAEFSLFEAVVTCNSGSALNLVRGWKLPRPGRVHSV